VSAASAHVFEFGEFRLDGRRRLLSRRDGMTVSLTPKAFDTLVHMVEHAGTILHKDELMRAVWADTVVEENNLNQSISILRRALGEHRGEHRYIATVPGRGYQFIATVTVTNTASARNADHEEVSIAVLPFVNVGADPEEEYFGDGLAEELINALSKLERVRVAARTSAFSFKGKQVDAREIAQRLGVHFIVEGSVRKSGNRMRVTAQLINAADGCHVWSDRYEREMELRDIFDVQDEITLAVLDGLQLTLRGGERSTALKRHTHNARAHELYLKGRFHIFRMSPAGIETGMQYFHQASDADPSFALAQVGLAHGYRTSALTLEMAPNEVLPMAKAAAERAIALDDGLAEAHAVLAFNIFWHEWNWNAAERHFRRALNLNPKSADTHWMYAHLCSNTGRHGEALAEIARARELDPLSGLIHAMEGQFLLHAGQIEEAIARLRESIELDSSSRVAHLFTARAYIEKGWFADARDEAAKAQALSPGNTQAIALESYAQAKAGRDAEARALSAGLIRRSRKRFVPPYHIAIACAGLNQTAEVLTWLERGFAARDPKMVFLKVDPRWKRMADQPRFIRLLNQMNF
jgi:TolB-like protein/Tfp pilus assembly protein PilF